MSNPIGEAQRIAGEYADAAMKADQAKDWKTAEEYYLLASQFGSRVNSPTMQKNVRAWDKAARRARRLREIGEKP